VHNIAISLATSEQDKCLSHCLEQPFRIDSIDNHCTTTTLLQFGTLLTLIFQQQGHSLVQLLSTKTIVCMHAAKVLCVPKSAVVCIRGDDLAMTWQNEASHRYLQIAQKRLCCTQSDQ
jgi:hypothetical protein